MYNYTQIDEEKCDFLDIASQNDLGVGERLFLEIGSTSIVLFNVAGQLFAIADVCSHDDGPLGDGEINGFEIICPRHGATFDVRTGKALSLPAIVDIPAYPVRIFDGQIQVGLPR